MVESTIVIDDCYAPSRPNITNIRLRRTPHADPNFSFSFDNLVAPLPSALSPLEVDWLMVAGSLYAADLACIRGTDLDWNRHIELHVPVHDPERWVPLKVRLEDAFGRLTYDRLNLEFHQRDTAIEPPRQRRTPYRHVEAVALLSGGIDSFVGGVDLLLSTPDTLFVSHTAAPVTRAAQRALEPALVRFGPTCQFASFRAQRGRGFGDREGSERSRTILFLACAGVVATSLGVEHVYINENGVLAVHVPLTEARIGSLSTRTAAPSFIDEFAALMSEVLGSAVSLTNRLVGYTKPEVVELAVSHGCDGDLIQTVSCWSIGRTGRHCGFCAPCMIRRISCETHGVSDVAYDYDIFGDPNVTTARPFARDNLVQLISATAEIANASDQDLELDYPELLNGGSGITSGEARGVHRRWARQALNYLRQKPVPAQFI
jgi:hypothetical protein